MDIILISYTILVFVFQTGDENTSLKSSVSSLRAKFSFCLLLHLPDTCMYIASLLQFSVTLTYKDSRRTKFPIVKL
jgi:hypothetical protein